MLGSIKGVGNEVSNREAPITSLGLIPECPVREVHVVKLPLSPVERCRAREGRVSSDR